MEQYVVDIRNTYDIIISEAIHHSYREETKQNFYESY